MTTRWLVGLDVDGTILLPDNSYSPGADAAVARLRDAGHEVTLATGRSWGATASVVERLGIEPEFVVCSNGAVIMRRTDAGDYVRDHVETFDPTVVLGLLEKHLPDARYLVELGDGRRLYTDVMDDWTIRDGTQVTLAELSREPVSRIVVISPGHDEEDFHRVVEQAGLNEVSYAIGWTAWLDIAPHGVDKGTGMERLRTHFDIPGERVLVAGDGRNDVGMFEWALRIGGRAAAMGQAPDEVKAAAGEVTGDMIEGGLAPVLDSIAAASDLRPSAGR